jgi:cell division protein FtsI/penicillin-binding protein 2
MTIGTTGEQHASSPRDRLQRRILAVKIGLLLSFAVLTGRLVQIQVVQAGAYQELARSAWNHYGPQRQNTGIQQHVRILCGGSQRNGP